MNSACDLKRKLRNNRFYIYAMTKTTTKFSEANGDWDSHKRDTAKAMA